MRNVIELLILSRKHWTRSSRRCSARRTPSRSRSVFEIFGFRAVSKFKISDSQLRAVSRELRDYAEKAEDAIGEANHLRRSLNEATEQIKWVFYLLIYLFIYSLFCQIRERWDRARCNDDLKRKLVSAVVRSSFFPYSCISILKITANRMRF